MTPIVVYESENAKLICGDALAVLPTLSGVDLTVTVPVPMFDM